MRYKQYQYQARILNRLADRAYNRGGLQAMKATLDAAMNHIWTALETGRHPQTIRHAHAMRRTV